MIETTRVRDIPQWATQYLYYDDPSGLDDEEIDMCDEFVKKLLNDGIMLVCPEDGTEDEFNPYPAFGLACDTVDWVGEIIPEEEKNNEEVHG